MKKIFIALAFIFALPFFVHAQSSGGFPSRPTFQAVTVSNGILTLNAPNSTTVQFLENAGTTTGSSFGPFIHAGTNSSDWALNITNAINTVQFLKLFGDSGTVFGGVSGSSPGSGIVNAAGFQINSKNNVPKFAAIECSGAAGAGVGVNAQNASGCTSSSTGIYVITLAAGFTSNPNCVASNENGSTTVLGSFAALSSTSATLQTVIASTGTATNALGTAVICVGL